MATTKNIPKKGTKGYNLHYRGYTPYNLDFSYLKFDFLEVPCFLQYHSWFNLRPSV